MSVAVKNLAGFDSVVQGWFAAVENAVAEAAVGLAHECFEQILEMAPQYSGDFVANTRYSIGAPTGTYEVFNDPKNHVFQMGSTPAMAHARGKANWRTPALGETLFISTTVKHDEAYAWKIEAGTIKLRPVNEGGDHIYRRAAAYTQHRYASIGRVQLDILRKIGS